MNCPHCFQLISGANAFCPHCGARLAEPSVLTASEAAEDPTYGALAHANLLRLRGDWEGAREKTVSVMREFPNSGTAHSLMGDIFADQQMYEEASQWYRMALDLEPNNVADSRKLAGAARHLQATMSASDTSLEQPSQFSVVRVAAVASMVFLVFAISLGFYVKTHTVPLSDLGPTWKRPSLMVVSPGRNTSPPAHIEQPTSPHSSTTEPDLSLGLSGTLEHSGRENALLAAIRTGVPVSRAPLALVDATIDPRYETCSVTVDASHLDASLQGWMSQLCSSALSIAVNALDADTQIKTATVRVVMPLRDSDGTGDDLAFIGDLDRPVSSLLSAAPTPTAFTRRWWHRGLTPPPEIAATSR